MPDLVFTPSTEVRLLSGVPLDPSYVNTRDFTDKAAQTTYFNSFLLQTFTDFTYQREGGFIKVPIGYDVAIKANYVMYLNKLYTSKWFYAFVTKVEYISENVSAVYIETDVIQTWLFDYNVAQCFIERETPANDSLYANTVPEGLDYGPIKVSSEVFFGGAGYKTVLAFYDNSASTGGELINNVFSGVQYLIYDTSTTIGLQALNDKLRELDQQGLNENIVGMFTVPAFIDGENQIITNTIVTTRTSIDGYTPRNRKVYGWPYCYLGIGWGMGLENLLRYELINTSGTLTLHYKGALNMDTQALLWPANYAGLEENYGEGVLLDSLPQCSWVSNAYANWLARNRVSNTAQWIGAGVGVVGAIAAASQGGGFNPTPFMNAFSLAAQYGDRSNYPTQLIGQVGSSTISASLSRIGVCVRKYEITAEYARLLDQFFDRFGYKVCKLALPRTKSRTRWNYIKTSGISITGPLPAVHLAKLQAIYDTGITFWHDNNIGNYTANNGFAGG